MIRVQVDEHGTIGLKPVQAQEIMGDKHQQQTNVHVFVNLRMKDAFTSSSIN